MITLKNISLRRGAKVLLDQTSVSLNPGEKVGLVGRNGAGKSSLGKVLGGYDQATTGGMEVFGQPATPCPPPAPP